ncbi:MAG: glycosyltransferase family 4 protein [Phycisphaerales bacterium]|nr:glycosyltransferase family 4 protein [Phycisphaerales bacterium]
MGDLTYSLTLHGFGALSEPSRWRLREKLERSLFAICVSSWARGQAMLWSDPVHWDKYHVVHCGIDASQFQPHTHDGRGKRLLFIGRFDPVKGLPLLIEAIDRLARDHPDVHLDLVGDGPLRGDLEAMVCGLELEKYITFHGYLSQAECRVRLQHADVLVISSFAEGIPVVLMEAMASRVAVLATNIAGIPELVEHGVSGVLVPSGDGEALAQGLDQLLASPKWREQLADAGRQRVERDFRSDLEAARLVHIFRERLAGRPVSVRPIVRGTDRSHWQEIPTPTPVGTGQ